MRTKFQNLLFFWKIEMPKLLKDGYLIAASTDFYQGFHFPDDYNNNPRKKKKKNLFLLKILF